MRDSIVILSGAGLSAQSGLRTFRDSDGLWEEYDVMEVCSVEGWKRNRAKVTEFYNQRRLQLQKVKPNAAHDYFAQLEQRYGERCIHLTQNVDNLLEQAGCERVIHLHGTLTELRCERCGREHFIGYMAQSGQEVCEACGKGLLRHNVVMFGEAAPNYAHITPALQRAKLFIAIGTSGQVLDISSMAKATPKSVLINPEREPRHGMFGKIQGYIEEDFDIFLPMKATEAIEEIERIIGEMEISPK